MSRSDTCKDDLVEGIHAPLKKSMYSHLFRLMEISGSLESRGDVLTAMKMREHIVAIDDIFSVLTDRGSQSKPTVSDH